MSADLEREREAEKELKRREVEREMRDESDRPIYDASINLRRKL